MVEISEQHDDEFKGHVDTWVNMDQNTNEASAYYDEHILPRVTEIFIAGNQPKKQYDGLILTVGGSPEPLILSICAIKPNRVGLLYAENRKDSLERIYNKTNLTMLDMIDAAKKVDGSKTAEIYQAIMNLYTEWGKPENIAVGVTGGKKSMVSGAAIAGAVLGADIYYVDTDKKNKLNKPEPGSEYLRLLDNPYTVFGDLEVNKAKDLYDRHDYNGAQRIFNQLRKQVGDGSVIPVYEAYGYLCETYEAWDNLDIDKAKTSLNSLLEILGRFSSERQLEPLANCVPILQQHEIALNGLGNIFNQEEFALHIPEGFDFAFMLYHNALRRETQGKLDIACLLFYRLLEWISQHRLAQYDIITSEPDYSKSGMEEAELLDLYQKKRKEVYKDKSVLVLPNPIELVDGFLILGVLGDNIVDNLSWGALRGRVQIRNHCVYIHGVRKIDEDDFKNFKETVEERFEKAQEIASLDADAFSKRHKFIAPLP